MAMTIGFIGGKKPSELDATARFAAENGFPLLEFDYWGDFAAVSDADAAAMRKTLDRHGVGVSAYGLWGYNPLSADPAERASVHATVERGIRCAATVGARVFVLGAGNNPNLTFDQNVEEFCRVFPPILARIRDAGMKSSFYAVHGKTLFENMQAFEAVWRHLPQVGMKFDPANWAHSGHDYIEVVRLHGNKMTHVHLKEHMYRNGGLIGEPPVGMGDVQWGKVMAFLHLHNYDGCLSIEPHGAVWSRGELRQKMVLLSRQYIRQYLL
jgi:sugar phosphate isomerase/epimerase